LDALQVGSTQQPRGVASHRPCAIRLISKKARYGCHTSKLFGLGHMVQATVKGAEFYKNSG
jgi:hypothetical protein